MGRTGCGTRDKLIAAAIDLIWQNSYSAVGVGHICDVAGVKKGSFYHFFPSKVDLALAAIQLYFETSRGELEQAFSAIYSPEERITRFARLICDRQQESLRVYGSVCGCPFATLGSEMAAQEERIRQVVSDILKHYESYFKSTLDELKEKYSALAAMDVSSKTAEMSAFVLGVVMRARIDNSLEYIEQELEAGLFRVVGLTVESMVELGSC